ncbi:MAG: hypothetical protein WEG36_09695 [Gemmatimonadota bacterium]
MSYEAQVRMRSWQGYEPIATITLEPEELARKTGIEFEPSHDDLDETLEAAIQAQSGRVFGLVRHVNSPVPGTEIYWQVSKGRVPLAIHDALEALEVSADAVDWVKPSAFFRLSRLYFSAQKAQKGAKASASKLGKKAKKAAKGRSLLRKKAATKPKRD